MSKELLKLALEKIATVNAMDYEYQAWAREALAEQPAQQEPVAWSSYEYDGIHHKPVACKHEWFRTGAMETGQCRCIKCGAWNTSLPVQRTWVGLSNEEIYKIYRDCGDLNVKINIAQAIEAKLKEKNT